jgi:hypothetical protein
MRTLFCLVVGMLTPSLAGGVRPIEIPEVAVCISGAVRSFATVPVLRGLKKHVLQSAAYSAKAFAALSYDATSPQLLEYNVSLARRLALPVSVRRALSHLRPELVDYTIYNTSDAAARFRSCQPSDDKHASTEVRALYGMQLCFGLVRTHEATRGDEKFDFVLRVRPDHLFLQPLPAALRMNVSSWPRDRLVTYKGGVVSFALVPSGATAAIYFRTFTAAASCLFREADGPDRMPDAFGPDHQCAGRPSWDGLAACTVRANMRYHGLPRAVHVRRRVGLIARVCNLNATTGSPAWPAWPMPPGETCITSLDALKRPVRPAATAARVAGGRGDGGGARGGGGGGGGEALWHATVFLVLVGLGASCHHFRERLIEDASTVCEVLMVVSEPLREAIGSRLAPLRPFCPGVYGRLFPRAAAEITGRGRYAIAAAADEDDDW